MKSSFRKFANTTAEMVGSSYAFLASAAIILAWFSTGPLFHFSDSWQLVIGTFTSVVTFLMVFLIQHLQNRDAKAVHLKLDELIRAVKEARTRLVRLEEYSDEEIEQLRMEFQHLQEREQQRLRPEP